MGEVILLVLGLRHSGRFLWISLRMTSLLQQSEIPLSASAEPEGSRPWGSEEPLNAEDAGKEAVNSPPLLVPSLMTEELRDGKRGAHEAAAAGVFRCLRLHSAQACT